MGLLALSMRLAPHRTLCLRPVALQLLPLFPRWWRLSWLFCALEPGLPSALGPSPRPASGFPAVHSTGGRGCWACCGRGGAGDAATPHSPPPLPSTLGPPCLADWQLGRLCCWHQCRWLWLVFSAIRLRLGLAWLLAGTSRSLLGHGLGFGCRLLASSLCCRQLGLRRCCRPRSVLRFLRRAGFVSVF